MHKLIIQHIIQTVLSNTKLRILHACICSFLICLLSVVCLFIKKQQHISDVLYFKDLVYVRINKTPTVGTAVRGGGGSKELYLGQGKMRFGQGKVSEKSGNFISD